MECELAIILQSLKDDAEVIHWKQKEMEDPGGFLDNSAGFDAPTAGGDK